MACLKAWAPVSLASSSSSTCPQKPGQKHGIQVTLPYQTDQCLHSQCNHSVHHYQASAVLALGKTEKVLDFVEHWVPKACPTHGPNVAHNSYKYILTQNHKPQILQHIQTELSRISQGEFDYLHLLGSSAHSVPHGILCGHCRSHSLIRQTAPIMFSLLVY